MLRSWVIYILSLLGAVAFFLFYKMWLAWFILLVVISILPIALLISVLSSRRRSLLRLRDWRHFLLRFVPSKSRSSRP